jgi:DNA polymerase elongation subunit (family B)
MAKDREYVNAFVDGQDLVRLFREPGGQVMAVRKPAEWSGFIRRDEVAPELVRELRTSAVIRGIREEGAHLRLTWTSPEVRRQYCTHPESPLQKGGVTVYEGDVDPVRRHFTDTESRIARPRRCYLDIETDSRVPFSRKEEMRLLSWAVVDHDTGERWSGVLGEWSDRSERELLKGMWAALGPFDQVCGWYLDGFDAPVVFARSALHKLPTDARRWLWLDHLEVFRKMNQHSAESGDEKRSMRLEDIGQSVTKRGKLKTPDWVVARFGDRSMGELSYQLWEAGGEFRDLLVRYNEEDTDLLRLIELETGYLDLFGTLCEACRLFADTRSLNPTQQMDGFMLRLGSRRDYRFPTKLFNNAGVKFKGAFVMQPTVLDKGWRDEHGMRDGILRNVHVCDYSAMYPSIILTWNMSPDTKVWSGPANGPIPEGMCRAPLTGICFRTGVEGILPTAIKEMLRLRKYWNDLKASLPPGTPEWHDADRRSTAYKVAVNAFYGVVGSPFSRFFDKQIAESVTQCGVWLLKRTLHEAEQRGFQAVYGDTDSGFVAGVDRLVFAEFVRWCNDELYPGMLAGQQCTENHVKLAYEKEFDRIVFTSAKRYCGNFRHYKWSTTCTCDVTKKGKTQPGALDVKTMTCKDCGTRHDVLPPIRSEPEIKGIEYKRGDVLKMAADLQAVAIDMLVGGLQRSESGVTERMEDYHGVLSRIRQRVLEHPLELGDVKLSKGLSKPLKEYVAKKKQDGEDAGQPPHVVVAHLLKQRGQDVQPGTRIDYFVQDGAASPMRVLPAEDWKGECDRYYLWESLVYPPTQRLLEAAFPDRGWDEWAKVRPKKPTRAELKAAAQPDLFAPKPKASATPGRALATRRRPTPQVELPEAPRVIQAPAAGPPAAADRPVLAEVLPAESLLPTEREMFQALRDAPIPTFRELYHLPEPYVLRVDEASLGDSPVAYESMLLSLRAVLLRHPGEHPLDLVLRLRSGAEAVLSLPYRVRVSPVLEDELSGYRARHKGTHEEAERGGKGAGGGSEAG